MRVNSCITTQHKYENDKFELVDKIYNLFSIPLPTHNSVCIQVFVHVSDERDHNAAWAHKHTHDRMFRLIGRPIAMKKTHTYEQSKKKNNRVHGNIHTQTHTQTKRLVLVVGMPD